jgi:hypothetical protein
VNEGGGRQAGGSGARVRRPGRAGMLALGLLAAVAGTAETVPPGPAMPGALSPDAQPVQVDRGDAAAIQVGAGAAELAAACDDAAFLLAAGRAREARARLDAIAAIAALAGPDHPQASRAASLLAAISAAESRSDVAGAGASRLAAAEAARARAQQQAAAAASLRAERLARARDLHARGHRELTLAHLRALLRDLPGDDEVEGLFSRVLEETFTARSAAIAERERELRGELALRMERSLIPEGFDGRPMFPDDWSERRSGRTGPLDVVDLAPAWQLAIADRLAARVTIGFDATPLGEAVEAIRRLGGINIVTAPELLAATDRLITLRAAGMRLEDVLTWIAVQARTSWSLANGAVYLGDEAKATPTIAVHDVGELLAGTSDFPGPRLNFGDGGEAGGPAGFLAPAEEGTTQATADDIADLIKRAVSPRTWEAEGNAITVRGDSLLITAPNEVQRLVREFLRAQSVQRGLSVRIEARWLNLYDRYVEEIGVQWTSGPSTLIDPGVGQSGGYVRRLNGWAIDGSTTNQLPASATTMQSVSGNGLTLQSAMLGGTKLSALLSAVASNAQGREVRTPELTCLNGQKANAFFGNQQAYISDYEVVGGNYDPVITVLNLGIMLEARPLVSSDRRFITLELSSATSSAELYTEIIVTQQTVGGTGNNGLVVPTVSYPIELPNLSVRTAGTTVMLPDQGSLLVGGFNAGVDQFAATRVPLLGSVPFLGRLFGARGRYSEKSRLYLLTTATIINYPELEARL